MRAVVDTNVVAYHLLKTAGFESETGEFWRTVEDPIAPAAWEAELANVVWMAVRHGIVPPERATARLGLAAHLGIHSVPNTVLWQGALVRSIQSGIAVYDTLFVELADREQVPLVTFDAKVVRAYPEIAKRPRDLAA